MPIAIGSGVSWFGNGNAVTALDRLLWEQFWW
jgi:hypothetical protein